MMLAGPSGCVSWTGKAVACWVVVSRVAKGPSSCTGTDRDLKCTGLVSCTGVVVARAVAHSWTGTLAVGLYHGAARVLWAAALLSCVCREHSGWLLVAGVQSVLFGETSVIVLPILM